MNPRLKFILGLSIFFTLIGIYFLDEYLDKKEQMLEDSSSVALYFKNEECIKLALQNQNGKFVFERTDYSSPWKILSPKQTFADQNAVNNLLVLLRNVSVQRTHANDDINLSQTGLQNPKLSFELTFNDGSVQKLDFGENLSTLESAQINLPSAYAKVSNKNEILIVDNSSIPLFMNNDFHSLRTKQIVNLSFNHLKEIQITNHTASFDEKNNNSIVSLQFEQDQWIVQKPIQTPASNEFIIQYLQYLQELAAETIIEPPYENKPELSEVNFNNPAASIALINDDNSKEILKSFMSTDGIYIQLKDGALAKLELDEWPMLVPAFKSFRDRSVFLNTKCSASFSSLTAVDVIDQVSDKDLEKFGLNHPQRTLSCASNDTQNSSEPQVFIGNRVPFDEKNVYVKRSDSNIVYIVDSELLSALAD